MEIKVNKNWTSKDILKLIEAYKIIKFDMYLGYIDLDLDNIDTRILDLEYLLGERNG